VFEDLYNTREMVLVRVLAISGSPRKNWNTATLLKNALEGAASRGAETELINLYDLNYKGCLSCFSCKLKDGKSYGRCAAKDDLTPVLDQIESVGALILGSPIYLGEVTGAMRSCLERLLFPYVVYDANHSTLFTRKIHTGMIYTMGIPENRLKESGYQQKFSFYESVLKRVFGEAESLIVTDTYQFEDYSRYVSTLFDAEAKKKRREEEFPKDCKKAFDMGVRFAIIEG
jgi:multimeric flavodoxin WrbA